MDATFRVRRSGAAIGWIVQGRPLVSFSWQRGDAICDAMRRAVSGNDGDVNADGNVQFRNALGKVLVLTDGKLRLEVDKPTLTQFGAATRAQCRKAEEEQAAERIARDGAILLRHGAPFGLTDDPKIRDMVKREAETNRTIRKALPGMRDTQLIGAPVVRKVYRTNIERIEQWKQQLQRLNRPH